MIVEDEELIARVLRIRLESLGYNVFAASDGAVGLEMVRKEHPDLAILDIGLPLIDGDTLRGLIKSEPATKDVRIIMLTGKKLAGGTDAGISSGVDVYVNKPFEWLDLLGHIKNILGESA